MSHKLSPMSVELLDGCLDTLNNLVKMVTLLEQEKNRLRTLLSTDTNAQHLLEFDALIAGNIREMDHVIGYYRRRIDMVNWMIQMVELELEPYD